MIYRFSFCRTTIVLSTRDFVGNRTPVDGVKTVILPLDYKAVPPDRVELSSSAYQADILTVILRRWWTILGFKPKLSVTIIQLVNVY